MYIYLGPIVLSTGEKSYPLRSLKFESHSFAGLKTIVTFFIHRYVVQQFTPLNCFINIQNCRRVYKQDIYFT